METIGEVHAASGRRGLFITFEGADGVGKTTHIGFLAAQLRRRGCEVVCLREPGGTPVGEKIRTLLLDPENDEMAAETELLLYEAARAQLTAQVIEPALDRGAVVLTDRFFDSTVAYQAYGRGIDRAFVDAANRFASRGLVPDRTLLMVTGAGAAADLERAARVAEPDRLEQAGLAFHERVERGFAAIAAHESARIRTVVSAGAPSETARRVFAALADLFPWMDEEQACPPELFEALDEQVAGTCHRPMGADDEADGRGCDRG